MRVSLSKSAALLAASLIATASARAQVDAAEPAAAEVANAQRAIAAQYRFTATADRPDATYKPGETVTFTCTLVDAAGKPVDAEVTSVVARDGMIAPTTAKVNPSATGGTFTATGTMNEAGFLQFEASFLPPGAARKLLARAGVAFDRDRIGPSAPEPADFDGFWRGERARLDAVPMNVRVRPVKSKEADVELFDVQADVGDGAVLSAYLGRPVGAKAKALPAIVLLHGAGVTSSRQDLVIEFAKSGLLALDFNVHGLPNGQPPAFYAGLRTGELLNYATRGKESRETIYFRGIFARLMRAIDVLAAQPEWDGRRLIASGRSQGGGQAIAAGGLDPRVTCVVAEIPALCDHTGVLVGRACGWPHFFGIQPRGTPDPKVIEAVRYYDAVNFARRIKAPAYVTVGWTDHLVPPTGVYAMFNALAGPKKMLDLIPLGHVQSPEGNAFVRGSIKEYLAQSDVAAK